MMASSSDTGVNGRTIVLDFKAKVPLAMGDDGMVAEVILEDKATERL